MIVDAYTHVWESPEQLGKSCEHLLSRLDRRRKAATGPDEKPPLKLPSAATPHHLAACAPADRAIVVAFKSRFLEANIPNSYVAEYAKEHPEKMVAFASLDPSDPAEALEDLDEAHRVLGMKGVAIAPAAQDFHPASSNAYVVYERVCALGLPVLIHPGIYVAPQHKLEYAKPILLDEVARDFPDLRLVITHFGFPWVGETIVLLEKHPNLYAELSSLLVQSWQAYTALLTAHQYGVMDKLLFGSGFPFSTAAKGIEALYSINQICRGTALPTLPREQLRGIVERPTLSTLGIADVGPVTQDLSREVLLTEDEPA